MSRSDIRVECNDHVTTVMIDRPSVRNAYRSQTCVELVGAIADFVSDDSRRVMILTGAGGSFCSGGDLSSQAEIKEAEERSFGHGMVMREGMHAVVRALSDCDKPVIAMIDGP